MARLSYLELPVEDTERAKAFYGAVFDWVFSDFGPTYSATVTGDTDVGVDAAPDRVAKPLPVLEVDDLEATLTALQAAGGQVTVPTFAFPGGRRFHFVDPDGHELAVMQVG